MEKIYRFKLVLRITIMLAGMLSAAFDTFDMSISIFLINLGLILFVITAFRLFRLGGLPDRDERTKNWQFTG
jgi:hypothetical protein